MTHHKLENDVFMCRCGDEEGKRCDEIIERAKQIVTRNQPIENDLDFVDRMLVWLALDAEFHFVWDQWGALSVQPFKEHPSLRVTTPAWIQCDRPTDALAAAIVHYYDKEPDGEQMVGNQEEKAEGTP